ncbi:MAG: RNA polymerase sigma factor [Proteobacteria bacterium]|nr:RNA polymerase sigma factor [Pseudomonadota bacterium]
MAETPLQKRAHALNHLGAPELLLATPTGEFSAHALTSAEDRLLAGLRAREEGALAALFERYGAHVQRVLVRTLGVDAELADLVQEVFVQVLQSVHQVEEAERLKAWITSVAVFTARGWIRARQRRRWLSFFDPPSHAEPAAPHADDATREAARSTYRVLERLSVDLRLPFALRYIDGMELTEVAAACEVSLATIKRRLAKAEALFVRLAQREPALRPWLEGGRRWSAT